MAKVEVKIQTNFNIDDMLADIDYQKRQIMEDAANKFLSISRNEWVGWVNPTGRSRAGWDSESGEDYAELSNFVDYVEWVHRAGQEDLTYLDIFDFLDQQVSPEIGEQLISIFEDILNA